MLPVHWAARASVAPPASAARPALVASVRAPTLVRAARTRVLAVSAVRVSAVRATWLADPAQADLAARAAAATRAAAQVVANEPALHLRPGRDGALRRAANPARRPWISRRSPEHRHYRCRRPH